MYISKKEFTSKHNHRYTYGQKISNFAYLTLHNEDKLNFIKEMKIVDNTPYEESYVDDFTPIPAIQVVSAVEDLIMLATPDPIYADESPEEIYNPNDDDYSNDTTQDYTTNDDTSADDSN